MRLFRIGDKVVSEEKIVGAIERILADREAGATQEQVAKVHSVQRSFVSLLESLGEIRSGARIALVAFPVANAEELRALADAYSLDVSLVLSQSQRENVEHEAGADIFNNLLDTMADLAQFETIIVCASDWRIETFQRIFENEVVGIVIGQSPLRHDVVVDLDHVEKVLKAVTSPQRVRRRGRMGSVIGRAGDLVRKWEK